VEEKNKQITELSNMVSILLEQQKDLKNQLDEQSTKM